ncbi:hypothetical protein K469DRAFT_750171 [Zopfia rhizophila CBS 207.26]|uniref:Uncharacterized protein n=1 Tax=Zopfia rhizophila CBS 207.26 TaxID=1314779 RepID=A0A6A6E1P3_9PEZI|nr:hypothetical protein K469DRAFT_750171 [Zopfia rhizophila CBS 207.26]
MAFTTGTSLRVPKSMHKTPCHSDYIGSCEYFIERDKKGISSSVKQNYTNLLRLEAEIGVTTEAEYFRNLNYTLNNTDFDDINSRLFDQKKNIALHRLFTEHIRDFTLTLLDVLQTLKGGKTRGRRLAESSGPRLGREDYGTYELEYMSKRL